MAYAQALSVLGGGLTMHLPVKSTKLLVPSVPTEMSTSLSRLTAHNSGSSGPDSVVSLNITVPVPSELICHMHLSPGRVISHLEQNVAQSTN